MWCRLQVMEVVVGFIVGEWIGKEAVINYEILHSEHRKARDFTATWREYKARFMFLWFCFRFSYRALGMKIRVDYTYKDTSKLAQPQEGTNTKLLPKSLQRQQAMWSVKPSPTRTHDFRKVHRREWKEPARKKRAKGERGKRMDRLLFDKYCETWWRGGGVFIADININFPGAALLAQHEPSAGKLERKFSEPQGRGIKEPRLRDLWHTELPVDPATLSLCLTHCYTHTHLELDPNEGQNHKPSHF